MKHTKWCFLLIGTLNEALFCFYQQIFVKSHSNIKGNVQADKLAVSGKFMPTPTKSSKQDCDDDNSDSSSDDSDSNSDESDSSSNELDSSSDDTDSSSDNTDSSSDDTDSSSDDSIQILDNSNLDDSSDYVPGHCNVKYDPIVKGCKLYFISDSD